MSVENIFPNAEQFDTSNTQLQRIAAALEKLAASAEVDGVLDAAVQAALDGTNTTSAFMAWAPKARKTCADDWELLSRWAAILQKWCGDTTFTLRSYDASVSGDSTMTPMDDLAKMTAAAQLCTEATDPVANWADEHPMGGWYIRANARIGADGEPVVFAIEGLDASFDVSGDLAPVQVFSLALWKREWGDGAYNYKSWRANRAADYVPYPGDVAVDGTKRPMTWHPAYPGGLDSSGALTSGSGLPPLLYTSASNGLTLARSGGAYEGLWSDCDTIWALDMWQLRHWNLENSGVAEGCTSYSLQYTVAMAESGVRRVLLTPAQSANLLAGSCVIVGDQGENTSIDRGYAYMRSIADRVRIASIESVEIDGTVYAAVNLDVADAFDTTETTVISTMPWYSGTTDKLPGHKDGAYYSLTVAKAPIRIMGVELMHGAYDIGLDPLYQVTANEDGATFDYAIYECRDSEKLAGSLPANHTDTGIRGVGIASGWSYVKAFIRTKLGVLFPYLFGGSSTTYYKSAFYGTSSAGVRCPWRFAHLLGGGLAGLACEHGNVSPTTSLWYGRPRLSGSGAKRGEWPA